LVGWPICEEFRWDMGAMRPEPDPPYPAAVAHGRALVGVLVAWARVAFNFRPVTPALQKNTQ